MARRIDRANEIQREDDETRNEKPEQNGNNGSRNRNGRGKNEEGNSRRSSKKETVEVIEESPRSRKMVHLMMPYLLSALAVFIVVCFFLIDIWPDADVKAGVGSVGLWIHDAFCGLFGPGAFLVPVVLAVLAVGWRTAVAKNAVLAKVLYGIFFTWVISAFLHAVMRIGDPAWTLDAGFSALWTMGVSLDGGGLIGGLLGELLMKSGLAGTVIIGITLAIVLATLLCGVTPGYVATLLRYRFKIWREARQERARERREQKAAEAAEKEKQEEERRRTEEAEKAAREDEERRAAAKPKRERKSEEPSAPVLVLPAPEEEPALPEEPSPDYAPVDDGTPLIIIPPSKDVHTPKAEETEEEGEYHSLADIQSVKKQEEVAKEKNEEEGSFSLSDIFQNNPSTEPSEEKRRVDRTVVSEEESSSEVDMTLLSQMKEITDVDEVPDLEDGIEEIEVEAEPETTQEYVFPPISMLAEDTNAKDEDVTEELVANAQKLMDTLKSFKVGIKEITYSRGPTITRYELKPDVGIRVRSIANLVDDIALSLATTGVRIEAPIPNKPAVGIEVPNRNANTVFLRSLIDTEKFSGESSKLTACLGADVAGKPMYFNIAKMPHLLIAGATGMGKSVCINSIIVSLLYKARPDEVKLILIDPKKVEFNIYKDIPHLYAPIVSEPTKAAGALASAVAEMERRFELIEEVGVRDIYNYNAMTKDDPDKEFMPQMVIIIDELADLMMTAADSVESSICRLAQKARAAGIHIIIGTQRPSVDVITGLIKANVPSRIAFTVASQVDSRTIIDIAGAEKLIGRGDMLFAPVGAPKPMRVQGAFVSEGEVEKIVEFIKANNSGAKYNDEFVSRIEEEAARCMSGGKKSGGGGMPDADMDSDGLDPKFREAVKIAVETGRVATSLLQRKLEIGYGRAAKIIDQMEEHGYVSPAEGNKPRRILISKEDFMQMTINDDI